jgi:hypothetical protein
MAYSRSYRYRGFRITTSSTELRPPGLVNARQFEACFSVVCEDAESTAWDEAARVVFDTRVHASMNARTAARRSIDTYLLAHAA